MVAGRVPAEDGPTAMAVARRLRSAFPRDVPSLPALANEHPPEGPRGVRDARAGSGASCPVLAWARSGAMWLTGWPDGPPQWPTGDVIGALEGVTSLLEALAATIGGDVRPLDVGTILTGRAARRHRARRGAISVGGGSRILGAADGWVAVTLSRPADLELLPALGLQGLDGRSAVLEGRDVSDEVWAALAVFVRRRPADAVEAAGQRLGLPVASLPPGSVPGIRVPGTDRPVGGRSAPGGDVLPWSLTRLGRSVAAGPRPLRVVDFSAMWAGPLCAHLLGRAGAEVVKIEDVLRPDAARRGDPWLFEDLHHGHELVVLDFSSQTGRRDLGALVDAADVVVEASRPRALGQLGLTPDRFVGARPGRTWVSITGYGRSGHRSNWVAFGDDAAAAAGLVGGADPRGPAFCADAVADPVTGLCAATGALASVASGGGHLVDCAMRSAAAFVNRFGGCDAEHPLEQRGGDWIVAHAETSCPVIRPRPPIGVRGSMPAGRGTIAAADR